ncbi:Trafficking protein particle complex subunit 8 [Smittium culicis]|uniref:Trafficking protein particle complex subunit 8 n=1 Tax=Smittium culicis TaxID=133412 RepID=A0A1R1YTY2_9FUNG|nr:Trafficking protein particle complex subunit 8 [Smittium culicis]
MKLEEKYRSGIDLVVSSFSPRILTVTTNKINEIATQNGFDGFCDLLKPFGRDVQVNSRIIDGEGASFYLDSLSVKFIDDCGNKKETNPSKKELSQWINSSFNEGVLDSPTQNYDPPLAYPWYTAFSNNWINTIGETSFQAFEHPIITLFIASLDDENPYASFKEMLNHSLYEKARKSLYNGGEMIVYYLLVSYKAKPSASQDSEDAAERVKSTEKRKAIYSELKKRLGSNTAFLEISSQTESIPSSENLWTNFTAFDINFINDFEFGKNISLESIDEIRRTVKQIISEGLISHMQRQILLLGEQTSSVRKGLTGRLFSAGRKYFSTGTNKLATKSTDDYGEVFYFRGSTEMKLRKLADYLFMLKGYRIALPVYNTASREFLSDKSWKCHAGSQEMIGICKLLEEKKQARNFAEPSLKNALESYKKSVWQSDLYSFRSVILYSEICKDIECYKLAISILLQLEKSTNSLCCALFLENVSQLCTFIGRSRKANLYNHLAAMKYSLGNEPEHSYRCYKIEKNSEFLSLWKKSSAEANSLMSILSNKLGDTLQSLECFKSLVNNILLDESHQNYNLQELNRLYNTVNSGPQSPNLTDADFELIAPIVSKDTVRLYLSPDSDGIDNISKWSSSGAKPAPRDSKNKVFCSPKEIINLLVILENPLKVPITLNNISLLFDYDPEDGSNEHIIPESLQHPTESISLEPLAQTMLSIQINAPSKGSVYIKGFQYLLNNTIPQSRSLALDGARLNDTLKQRTQIVYKDQIYPQISVLNELPYLSIKLCNFPDSLISGQVVKVYISIINVGVVPVNFINIWTSHPNFFYADDSNMITTPKGSEFENAIELDNSSFYYFEDFKDECNTFTRKINNSLVYNHTKKISFDKPICPGDEIKIPVWMRGDRIGPYSFGFVVGYPHMSPKKLLSNEMRTFSVEEICDIDASLQINKTHSKKSHLN